MARLLLVLASATAVAFAQTDDFLARATVQLQVRDKAVDKTIRLARNNASPKELKAVRVHQPYTLVLSGAIISGRGEILTTALHPRAELVILVTFFDGSAHLGEVVGTDPRSNLALVRVGVPTPYFVELENGRVHPGHAVRIVGHDKARAVQFDGSVTRVGMPVALRDLYRINSGRPIKLGTVFMVASPVRKANPGSLCVDADGRCAGIVIGDMPPRRTRTGVYQFTFVVPTRRAARVVRHLREHGRVIRSYYGVSLLPVDLQVRAHFPDLPSSACAVLAVERNTPASAAGLRRDDIVVSVDGEDFANTYALGAALADKAPGKPVKLSVIRAGRKVGLRIVPRERDR